MQLLCCRAFQVAIYCLEEPGVTIDSLSTEGREDKGPRGEGEGGHNTNGRSSTRSDESVFTSKTKLKSYSSGGV